MISENGYIPFLYDLNARAEGLGVGIPIVRANLSDWLIWVIFIFFIYGYNDYRIIMIPIIIIAIVQNSAIIIISHETYLLVIELKHITFDEM